MPTAARLIAGVIFAAVAALAAHLFIPALPEGTQVGYLREISAGLGLICGWMIMGRLTGKGYGEAMGSGIRTAISIAFWALLGFSIYVMVDKSTRMLYDGPMAALLGTFDLMLGYGKMMLTPGVLGTLLIGGIIGGVLAEWGGRRWR